MTAIALSPVQYLPLSSVDFSREQLDLIKTTLAPDTSDLEFQLFMEVARAQGLNPLQRQIHAVMREQSVKQGNQWVKVPKMVIQTGIDGYRLIAARTGLHLGTTDATFGPLTKEGFPAWAQVTVKKLVHGHIAEYPATAYWEEYVQTKRDGSPNQIWANRPKGQLSKCAEALALRKAFPAELSGVYTDTEMEQADNPAPLKATTNPVNATAIQRIEAMAARVRKYGEAEVQAILEMYNWRSDLEAAKATYSELVAFGKSKAEPTPVMAETLASNAQKQLLSQHAARAGAKTTEARAKLWGHLANNNQPVRTTELTEEQASALLGMFADWSNDEVAQVWFEAQKAVK